MKPKNFKKINNETFTDNHGIERNFELDGAVESWIWVFDVESKTRNAFRFQIDWDTNTYDVLTVESGKGLNGKYFHTGCKITTVEYRSIDAFKNFMIKWLDNNKGFINKQV